MKKIFIGLVTLLIILGVIIIINVKNNSNSKTLKLTYQTNGGVPYEWQYEIDNKDIVEFVKSYETDNQNKNGLVGAPININYIFKGLKEGTATITFKYVNITNGIPEKNIENTVKVDKNKNISLVDSQNS